MNDSGEIIIAAAQAADDKKAGDIVSIDLRGVSLVADYFLICEGRSATQVKAIAQGIVETLQENEVQVFSREGYRDGKWILLDFGSVVVHVFQEEERKYFDLERLWGDAPQFPFPFHEDMLEQKKE